jgi:hypothetical protein
MEEEVNMDITPLLAAIVKHEGGEYSLPFEEFVQVTQTPNLALTMDLVDDGATFLIRIGQVPEDADV